MTPRATYRVQLTKDFPFKAADCPRSLLLKTAHSPIQNRVG